MGRKPDWKGYVEFGDEKFANKVNISFWKQNTESGDVFYSGYLGSNLRVVIFKNEPKDGKQE